MTSFSSPFTTTNPQSAEDLRNSSEQGISLQANEDIRTRNREQLIEKLQKVIQEKNASIAKLEERELNLEEELTKKSNDFRSLEGQLRLFEEKTRTFEQLHQLQVNTFEKTIRDCQSENERLCDHVNELTNQLRLKYEETNDLHAFNQDKVSTIREQEKEIDNLKLTLRRVRDTLQPGQLLEQNRWRSCSEDIGRHLSRKDSKSSNLFHRTLSAHSPIRHEQQPQIDDDIDRIDTEFLQKKIQTLTNRLTNVQNLLVKRDEQIGTLKKVHDKRWLRLKQLQKQYRLVKDQLQSYIDEQQSNDYDYKKPKNFKNGCSVCDRRWSKNAKLTTKTVRLKQEDDDGVWNEVGKLRRQNTHLTNENMSLQEKIDLQQVELNEQSVAISELQNEIEHLNDEKDKKKIIYIPTPSSTINNDNLHMEQREQEKQRQEQQHLIEQLDKKLYDLETQRTCLVFEHERLKTNLELSVDEKNQLVQQRNQNQIEIRNLKQNLSKCQQDLKQCRRKMTNNNKRKKSCLEVLLEQNPMSRDNSFVDDLDQPHQLFNRVTSAKSISETSSNFNRDTFTSKKRRACSLCDDDHNKTLSRKLPGYRTRRNSTLTMKKCEFLFLEKDKFDSIRSCSLSKNYNNKVRLSATKRTFPVVSKSSPIKTATSTFNSSLQTLNSKKRVGSSRTSYLRYVEKELYNIKGENDQLNKRLSSCLNRIANLKMTNQRLMDECEKLKNDMNYVNSQLQVSAQDTRRSINSNNSLDDIDNLQTRLKNTSFDASKQRKLNKTLQTENDLLNRNVQTLTEKLQHMERDIVSKRQLIENYKVRTNEMELNLIKSGEKSNKEGIDDDRLKTLNETNERLRVSIDSYKHRLQAITRDKQTIDARYLETFDELQKLKVRFDDIQSKLRYSEQQMRQCRLNNDQLNNEIVNCRHLSEQQLITFNMKTQDSLSKMNNELSHTHKRLNEHEKFITGFINEMIQRSNQMMDNIRRTREQQKQRESFSISMPGYDNAMNISKKILNLTQDDLDDIMSTTDESFQSASHNHESLDKDMKVKRKISKLISSQ
ncbi:unnamed protein product, partial [Didymodactylos carnosus]